MGNICKLLLSIFCACFLFHPLFVLAHANTITSCSQLPYPEVCSYFIDQKTDLVTTTSGQDQKITFNLRDQSILVTLDHAKQAHQLISMMDLSSFDQRAKMAWTDCLELYEDSVDHLNHSLSSTKSLDSQTWLSAAITNHQTCRNGFLDLNLESHLDSFPIMLTNFSKLLSNSLAINKDTIPSSSSLYNTKQGGGGRKLLVDGFPSWVSAADRKLLQSTEVNADIVVAQDGSGNYKTINEAVAAAEKSSGGKRFVIYVKKGVYKENVEIKKGLKNLMIKGDGIDATVVTGSKSAQETTTFRSATFAIAAGASGFIARDMTFENTAGPAKHQAVALRSGSDNSVYFSCSFKGFQDTLYVYSMRQFYKNCDIYGTVDFIFGDAVAVLQSCNINMRKGMGGQKNTVTAQARTDPNENTGIVIHNSHIGGGGGAESYLGRPWQKYSRTVVMKSSLEGISAAGWLPWSGSFALSTLYYAEYMNSGPSSGTSGRVNWGGYHVITSPEEAGKFTVGNFLAGNSWIPATGVPFDAGL